MFLFSRHDILDGYVIDELFMYLYKTNPKGNHSIAFGEILVLKHYIDQRKAYIL